MEVSDLVYTSIWFKTVNDIPAKLAAKRQLGN